MYNDKSDCWCTLDFSEVFKALKSISMLFQDSMVQSLGKKVNIKDPGMMAQITLSILK